MPPRPLVPQWLPLYLRQPVPQRLDHDAAVVVTLLHVGPAQVLHSKAGDSKQAQVVADARMQRGDEVRQAVVGICAGRVLLSLETQGVGRDTVSKDVEPAHSGQPPRLVA